MSHELRTPLNGILGFAQILQLHHEPPLDVEQATAVDQIIKGGNHLLDLIKQVLVLSQIQSRNLPISIEVVPLGPLIDDCLNLIRKAAAERDLIIVGPDGQLIPLPVVQADRVALKQVLLNLLMNAVKYNTTGRRVAVEFAFERDGHLRLIVSDDGPGIPADRHHEVFTSFNRLGMESKGIEGTGIGLTISQELVHLMEGEIGFDSIEGEGTSFWVDMVLAETDLIASPPRVT